MTQHTVEYEFDEDRDNIHLYMVSSGKELRNSPVDATGTVKIPTDFFPVIAYEAQQEFKNNGFTDLMLDLVLALGQPETYVQKRGG